MMSRLISIAAGLLLLSGCSLNFVRDADSLIKTEPFSALDVAGPFTLNYKKSERYSIRVSGDQQILRQLEFTYLGGMAHIALKNSLKPLTLDIEAPSLESIYLEGFIKGTFKNIQQDTLVVRASGSYALTFAGHVKNCRITASGDGLVDAHALEIDAVSVESSAAASVLVGIVKKLDVKAYGASVVRYSGDPVVTRELAGAASLTKV